MRSFPWEPRVLISRSSAEIRPKPTIAPNQVSRLHRMMVISGPAPQVAPQRWCSRPSAHRRTRAASEDHAAREFVFAGTRRGSPALRLLPRDGQRAHSDPSDFEQFEAEGLDLQEDAEHRGAIFKQAGQHRLAVLQLRLHRGKGGESGRAELAAYADRVKARRFGHAVIVRADLVSRGHRNLMILPAMRPCYSDDIQDRPAERSRNCRAR